MKPHLLTITSDPEFGRECEVEHSPDCPMGHDQHGYLTWTCQEGWFMDEYGLPDHLTEKEPGEYWIEFWVETRTNYTGATEYEYGLDLVSE
jgi:hypothetical protein